MKTIITLLAACAGFSAAAQNISNPDFEDFSSCPTQQTNPSYTLKATGWTKPTAGTSDYFNSCNFNIASHISAYSGAGFVGGYMEIRNNPLTNYKEYLTNHLSAPLVAGVTYTITFYTAHLHGSSPAVMLPTVAYTDLPVAEQGFIGIAFSTAAPVNANTEAGSSNYGSIVNTFGSGRVLIPVTNTDVYGAASRNTWVPVTLQYTAVGGEEYMTFGQFRPGATSLTEGQGVYYLFDGFAPSLTVTPLPVRLKSFTANKEGAIAQLKWVTANESNNKGFELQRSADGKSWTAIGFVVSQTSGAMSLSELSYSYRDEEPLNGTNYYRLTQVDRDGKEQFSAVQTLNFDLNTTVRIYPNPVRSTLSVNGLRGDNTLKLINLYGQVLQTIKTSTPDIRIDLSLVSAGMYSLQISDGTGNTTNLKIIKE